MKPTTKVIVGALLAVVMILGLTISMVPQARNAACIVRVIPDCSVVPELDRMCAVASEVEHLPISDAEKTAMRLDDFRSSLPTPKLVRLVKVLAVAAPASRYPILVEAAADDGAGRWSCAVLERMMTPKPESTAKSIPSTGPTHD